MIIPLLATVIPALVSVAEKLIPSSGNGSKKKDMVLGILGKLYDKFLASRVPDFQGIDERALFLEVSSHVIDMACDRLFNKVNE